MGWIKTTAELAKQLGASAKKVPLGAAQMDSRLVQPGDLFFAIRGAKVDGHDYLEEVAKRGAVAAVVESDYQGEDFGLLLFPVSNVLLAMQQLARKLIAQKNPYIVAITGSVGKTTTKEFIATLLEKRFNLSKTPSSFNSQAGLPLSILNMRGDEELLVLEMSMSEPSHLKNLVSIAPPNLAVLTRIGHSHFAFFKTQEALASAKAEIFLSEKLEKAILHEANLQFDAVKRGLPEKFQTYSLEHPFAKLPIPFTASHLIENFVAAALVARQLGMSEEEILERAAGLALAKNRFEQLERSGITIVNDSYNAAPDSVLAALANLPQRKEGKKRIFAFGSMKELGDFCKEAHEKVALAALEQIDELHCLGAECLPAYLFFEKAGKSAQLHASYQELASAIKKRVEPGDVLLIKGSNSHQLWRLLEVFD